MKRKLLSTLLTISGVLAISSNSFAVNKLDFEVLTTQNLINLCSVPANDPLAQEAIHFCHGYVVGAYDFHMAESKDSGKNPWFCLPEPEPTRNESVAAFIKWANANPQYMQELPVETEFRFLVATYPCNNQAKEK